MDLSKILVKLFGDKKSRDLKAYRPQVEAVLKVYPEIQALSNDELRARTQEIKQKVQDSVSELRTQISELRSRIPSTDIQDRAPIFAQIDKLEKDVLERFEQALDEVRPEVFAIVKRTAELFAKNETVEVTANDFDRQLAARHDFVDIDGEKATTPSGTWFTSTSSCLVEPSCTREKLPRCLPAKERR